MSGSVDCKGEWQPGGLLIPGLAAAFATYYLVEIWGERFETMAYGLLVGSLVLALCLIVALSHRRRREPGTDDKSWYRSGPGHSLRRIRESWRAIFLLGALLVHAVIQPWIGFTQSTALFLGTTFWVLGTRQWSVWISITSGLALVAHIIFFHLLNVPLPRGHFF